MASMINLSSLGIPMMKGLRLLVREAALTMGLVTYLGNDVLDSFRRFVKKIGTIQNPEFGIDISKGLPKIADYGNI